MRNNAREFSHRKTLFQSNPLQFIAAEVESKNEEEKSKNKVNDTERISETQLSSKSSNSQMSSKKVMKIIKIK